MDKEREKALKELTTLLTAASILSKKHRLHIAVMSGTPQIIDMDYPGGYMHHMGGLKYEAVLGDIAGGYWDGGDW